MQTGKCFLDNEEAARDKKEILGTWIQIVPVAKTRIINQ